MRQIEESLGDYPDLQQHYQSLRMNEQLHRQNEEQNRLRRQLVEQQALQSLQTQQQAYQNHLLSQYQSQYANPAQFQALNFIQSGQQFPGPQYQQNFAGQSLQQQQQVTGQTPQTYTDPSVQQYLRLVPTATESSFDASAAANGQSYPFGNGLSNSLHSASPSHGSFAPSPSFTEPEVIEIKHPIEVKNNKGKKKPVKRPYISFPSNRGTFKDLLEASSATDEMEEILVPALLHLRAAEDFAPDAHRKQYTSSPSQPQDQMLVETPTITSALPGLPEEPDLSDDNEDAVDEEKEKVLDIVARVLTANDGFKSTNAKQNVEKELVAIAQSVSAECDPWWPSTENIRAERRISGVQSDEDDFEDRDLDREGRLFRRNTLKLQQQLTDKREPGVAEKLPHCRIHRLRNPGKWSAGSPDLLFCWQVTDLYTDEVMVCCSVCGTWRHALCGGHYTGSNFEDVSVLNEPGECICDFCKEEKTVLDQYPQAKAQIEVQRMEWTRRALATASISRHFPYSKNSPTYKWPPGRVPESQFAAHLRSIQARHDKSAKQWTDMVQKLSKTYVRPRERIKSRSKELERVLAAIEDAEGWTDRHNMIVFLSKDTARAKPVGTEREERNFFDPADDHLGSEATCKEDQCIRAQCNKKRRFDSKFCSDACGLHVHEVDLMNSLFDASDIHPSLLRDV